MKVFVIGIMLAVGASGCARGDAFDMAAGSDVTLQRQDGVTIAGRLVEVSPEYVIVQAPDGVQTTVARKQISRVQALKAVPAPATSNAQSTPTTGDATASTTGGKPVDPASAAPDTPADRAPAADEQRPAARAGASATARPVREVTLPEGTVLPLTLRTTVGSDTSSAEDQVRATLRTPVRIDGVEALPAGTAVIGHVTNAQQSARVKGRGQIAFRFTQVDLPGDGGMTAIRTATVLRTAPATKKRDAATIGGGAVGGAIIGGIVGGGDGAAKGAAIGGAGGTGVVLATRGKDVRMPAGTAVSVKLTQPLTVRIR
jgi:hypothetical protein